MTTTKLLSPVDGRIHADRMPLSRAAAMVARPLAERIALVKAGVAKLIENKSVLSPLGFHAVTRVKSCHLKKVTP